VLVLSFIDHMVGASGQLSDIIDHMQLGAYTSPICCVDIAAATTATGRAHITKLRDFSRGERLWWSVSLWRHRSLLHDLPRSCRRSMAAEGQGVMITKCTSSARECSAAFHPY
jgi:hypothetical protein